MEFPFHIAFLQDLSWCHAAHTPTYFWQESPKVFWRSKYRLSPNWEVFIEQLFTYIIIFESVAKPHVLPLYAPDKLLEREITYQITWYDLAKRLKDSKKSLWPVFLVECGAFTLNDFGHAIKEIQNIEILKLATIPSKQYDPDKIA